MTRYINEDEFVAWVKEHWCADCQNDNGLRCRVCWIDDAIDIVEEAPEADVVPKSEVERWRRQLEAVLEEIPETKREVASEIFAEIEIVLCCSVYPRVNANGTITPISSKDWHIRCDDYNAIKKKYTEREK